MMTAPKSDINQSRLPVPSLWLDVFQKIKALGFNCVSFYIDWALLEGKPGEYRADGALALEPMFDAAMETGLYLIARPGPYINAEVSGGGFPGWLQRINGTLRTDDPSFLDATEKYEPQSIDIPDTYCFIVILRTLIGPSPKPKLPMEVR